MADIKPGQWISVTIKKQPKSAGGRKTLTRLCEQDPVVKKERLRLDRSRPSLKHRRGGGLWADITPPLATVQMTPGASYRIFASLDVLKDMKSVEQYVDLAVAK